MSLWKQKKLCCYIILVVSMKGAVPTLKRRIRGKKTSNINIQGSNMLFVKFSNLVSSLTLGFLKTKYQVGDSLKRCKKVSIIKWKEWEKCLQCFIKFGIFLLFYAYMLLRSEVVFCNNGKRANIKNKANKTRVLFCNISMVTSIIWTKGK